MSALQITLTPENLTQHKNFLKKIHHIFTKTSLYENENFINLSVQKYVNDFLPKLARNEVLSAPSFEIAWIWHCHRLSPIKYGKYCLETFGEILDAGEWAFQVGKVNIDVDEIQIQEKKKNLQQTSSVSARSLLKGYDLYQVSTRQKNFLWHILPSHYDNQKFQVSSINRYKNFLKLMKKYGINNHFYVPSYDIDHAWHSHMLMSTSLYLRETRKITGSFLNHDDSDTDRSKGGNMDKSWEDTKTLWAECFPNEKSIATDLTSYRGSPEEWFQETDGSKIFKIFENFLNEEEVTEISRNFPNDDEKKCEKLF